MRLGSEAFKLTFRQNFYDHGYHKKEAAQKISHVF